MQVRGSGTVRASRVGIDPHPPPLPFDCSVLKAAGRKKGEAPHTRVAHTKSALDLPLQNDFRVILVVPLWLT
jgi:hypothetical protein